MVFNSDPPGCLSNARTIGIPIFRYILKRVLSCTVVLKTKSIIVELKKNMNQSPVQRQCVNILLFIKDTFQIKWKPECLTRAKCASEIDEQIPKQPATSFIKDTSSSMIEFLTSCFLLHWVWWVRSHFYEPFLPSVVTSGKTFVTENNTLKEKIYILYTPPTPKQPLPKTCFREPCKSGFCLS